MTYYCSNSTLKFDVTPNPLQQTLMCMACIAGGLIFTAWMIAQNPVRILGVAELHGIKASIFHLVALLACFGAGIAIGYQRYRLSGGQAWLILGQNAVTGPRTYGGDNMVSVEYNAIARVKHRAWQGQEFLEIFSYDGTKLKVGTANFKDKSEWPRFVTALRSRVSHRL